MVIVVMKWNPVINALLATTYITAVVLFMRLIESLRHDTPDTIIDGLGMLSLLVLSVAVMAFLFFYQPLSLLLENKRKEATLFLLKTFGTFGVVTILVLIFVYFQ